MAIEKVKQYFARFEIEDRIIEPQESSSTVEEAARAVGCEPARITKTLSFLTQNGPILVVTAGDAKIDNKKFKEVFSVKARMIPGDQVEELWDYSRAQRWVDVCKNWIGAVRQ